MAKASSQNIVYNSCIAMVSWRYLRLYQYRNLSAPLNSAELLAPTMCCRCH
jgi:hypothetical protein